MAVIMEINVFWNLNPHSLAAMYADFGETCSPILEADDSSTHTCALRSSTVVWFSTLEWKLAYGLC